MTLQENDFIVRVESISEFKSGGRKLNFKILLEDRVKDSFDEDALNVLYQVISGGVLNTEIKLHKLV